MADFIYTIKASPGAHPEYATVGAALADFLANDRMGAGVGVVAASSTLYLRVEGFLSALAGFTFSASINTSASGAAVVLESISNSWAGAPVNVMEYGTGFDGLSFNSFEQILVLANKVTIRSLVIEGGFSGNFGVVETQQGSAAMTQTIERCIIKQRADQPFASCIRAQANTIVRNCLLVSGVTTANTARAMDCYLRHSTSPTVEHCTIIGGASSGTGGAGISDNDGTGAQPTVKNTYVGGFATNYGGLTYNAGSAGNASSSTDAPGSSPNNSVAQSATNFVSVSGAGDYRPTTSMPRAVRLASALTDAYGTSRADPASIGAGEFAAAAAPVISTPVQTLTAINRTTAGATIDSGGTTGTMYALARTGGSAALSGPIISGGQNNATTGTGAKTVPNTVLAAGTANQYVDMVYVDATNGTSNVVTVGPITTASALAFSGTIPTQTVTTGAAVDIDLSSYWSGTGFGSLAYSSIGASIAGASSGLSLNTATGHITGTAGAAQSISGVQLRKADSGSPVSQADSNTFTLTISAAGTAPSISSHPSNQTVTEGATATFTVSAAGSGTLTYQWQRNGSNISGATSSSYTTPATTVSGGSANNGDLFRCVVTGDTSPAATSNAATLTVNAAGGAIAGTFTLPGAADRADKQEVTLHTVQALSALAVNGNGATVNGAPASLSANGFFRLRFDAQSVAWYRVG